MLAALTHRITYLCKLIGIHSLAAWLERQQLWIGSSFLTLQFIELLLVHPAVILFTAGDQMRQNQAQ
ncbi:hypothetical protein A6J63_024190 [Yersinia enterocolitica]|nr:hypothetical protein A6J63_024190 [Yersinia enterocolitica]